MYQIEVYHTHTATIFHLTTDAVACAETLVPNHPVTGRQLQDTKINAMQMAAELNPFTEERGHRRLHNLCLI